MNYRHAYHAGNFADVVKHVILTTLITAMTQKNKPFCYIDTHAGPGYCDLFSVAAQKSKEYENGIEKIIQSENPPVAVKDYLNCVHEINNQLTDARYASLHYYPGSPMLVRHLIRSHDRIIGCELHPEDYQALRQSFAGDKQVALHHLDGYQGLKAFLPPPERRAVVLIDPPYENPDEFTRLAHTLPSALKRFESGIYAVWYPIKDRPSLQRFYRALKTSINKPVLAIELTIYPDIPSHLNGCGLVIINPPWQFEQTLQPILPWLWKALTINNQGGFSTFTLK